MGIVRELSGIVEKTNIQHPIVLENVMPAIRLKKFEQNFKVLMIVLFASWRVLSININAYNCKMKNEKVLIIFSERWGANSILRII